MLRFVPPAGTPLKVSQVLTAWKSVVSLNGAAEGGLASLGARLRVRHSFGVSSGRTALWLILKSLHRLRPDRCVVAVPAYTCFSVPASILRAGLKLYPVEIDPATLDYSLPQLALLPKKELLCILTSNLFGLVNDIPQLEKIARSKGAFLVDDAAQALGATWDGRFAGTFGDVGFYSFGRGKALSVGEGGLIVTDSDEIAEAIRAEWKELPAKSFVHLAMLTVQLICYSVFLDPRLYWVPNSLPFLNLGVAEFDPSFPVARMSTLASTLVSQLMDTLETMNQIRRRNARMIVEALSDTPCFTVPRSTVDCQPSYLRLPLIARDEVTRQRALMQCREVGIGASESYPTAICDIPGIQRYVASSDFHRPQAEALARKLITLPVHPLVQRQDLDRMIEILTRS